MARKGSGGSVIGDETTVAEVLKILEAIEWHCRRARLLLKGLDKKTPIKLSRQVRAMMKEPAPGYQTAGC